MREIQWPHSLFLSLNLRKPDVPVCQTGASSLGCNDYNLNFRYSGSKNEGSGFYWLFVTPTFYRNKICPHRSAYKNAYQIVVHMKNFPKINLV
jgi:hypothetical protein